MKLKTPAGLDQEDLEQYSLKNFDLKAFQRAQEQPAPAPIPGPNDFDLLKQEAASPSPLAAAPEAASPAPPFGNPWTSTLEQPNGHDFSPTPNPIQNELSPPALAPCDVQFGPHFSLQTISYDPYSRSQQWKLPRWVVTMLGLFFGSATVLTIAFCVVLLRDPKPAPTAQPTAQPAVATAPVAATNNAPGPVTAAASAPAQAVRPSAPAPANLKHDDSALPHRSVVSRHPSVIRRQIDGPRRVAHKTTSSSVAPQETETASTRPPPDPLDKLLGESSL